MATTCAACSSARIITAQHVQRRSRTATLHHQHHSPTSTVIATAVPSLASAASIPSLTSYVSTSSSSSSSSHSQSSLSPSIAKATTTTTATAGFSTTVTSRGEPLVSPPPPSAAVAGSPMIQQMNQKIVGSQHVGTTRSMSSSAVAAVASSSSSGSYSQSNSSNNNNNASSLAVLSTACLLAAANTALASPSTENNDNTSRCDGAAAPAATATATARPTATSAIGLGIGAGGGGGGGPDLVYPTAVEEDASTTDDVDPKQQAELDVRRWEEETAKNPFLVSEGAVQGARWTMEDAKVVKNGGHFVAVFDGHGGSEVSSRLRDRLYEFYTKALPQRHMEDQERRRVMRRTSKKKKKTKKKDDDGPSFPSIRSHTAAMRSAIRKIEREVLREDDLEFQGSTCVAVLVHTAEDGSRTLLSANVGDSRAILSRGGKAVDLTRDHKPSDERERARIRSMGEDVQWDPWGQIYRIRDLSLSRAIGDRFAKPIVTSEAEMLQEPMREDEDEFFLLASDGLYDVMKSQEVVDFVRECVRNDPEFEEMYGKLKFAPEERKENMAEIVANEALERGSADNVCVIVVWLKDLK
eukprot:CAMPEP_0113513490 /NCGR_PEP_ID=MMETSP0014_2-20120614/39899_1 /TAXON_ID=2857 /ORGANISM="Nitzschia sp." /LENGTH=581 /DNA_ID=CAMNT_0000409915 /DNA_START=163 /DNA_END=1908 /DNA_ORIENTATION=+ /assembly_acc=CAM_ASM_000159